MKRKIIRWGLGLLVVLLAGSSLLYAGSAHRAAPVSVKRVGASTVYTFASGVKATVTPATKEQIQAVLRRAREAPPADSGRKDMQGSHQVKMSGGS